MAGKRVALVTGAGSGIGKSASLALLKDGYHVPLVGRRKDLLEKVAARSVDSFKKRMKSKMKSYESFADALVFAGRAGSGAGAPR